MHPLLHPTHSTPSTATTSITTISHTEPRLQRLIKTPPRTPSTSHSPNAIPGSFPHLQPYSLPLPSPSPTSLLLSSDLHLFLFFFHSRSIQFPCKSMNFILCFEINQLTLVVVNRQNLVMAKINDGSGDYRFICIYVLI